MSSPNPKDPHQAKDELADALNQMSSGKAEQSNPSDSQLSDELLSNVEIGKPERPKTPVPAKKPASSGSSRDAAPPSRRPQRPAAPLPAPPQPQVNEFVSEDQTDAAEEQEDADDALAVPAPPPEVFSKSASTGSIRRVAVATPYLGLRRTLVPILLTNGLLLPVLGALWFMTEDDSPFRATGMALPIVLIAVGAVFLILGLANAMALRHQLQRAGEVTTA